MVRLLHSYGASINLQGGIAKWTPLFFAALCGRHLCVEALLKMGADKDMCDARGLKCIDMVEKEIKKLKRRIRKEGLATSPIPSATTISGGSSTVETHDLSYLEDLQSIVSWFLKKLELNDNLFFKGSLIKINSSTK